MPRLRHVAGMAIMDVTLPACDREKTDRTTAQSERSTLPAARPTHKASFRLLSEEPAMRRAQLGALVIQAGHQCSAVLKAWLEGGLDGSDEWTVKCADGGTWRIWFTPEGDPDVQPCPACG